MDQVTPEVTVRISAKQKFTDPWMTLRIKNSNNKCQRLYKEMLKKGCSEGIESKYKAYRNALNRLKCQAKWDYYTNKVQEYKNNTRKLWQLINACIGKQNHSCSIIP